MVGHTKHKKGRLFRNFRPKQAEKTKFTLSIVDYDAENLIEKENTSLNECLKYFEKSTTTWIQVYGASDAATVATLGEHFKIHPLVQEDILHTHQRPKIDVYPDQIYIVVRLLHFRENDQQLSDEQISIVIGKNYLISFSEREEYSFNALKEKLRQAKNRIRQNGSDFLAYSILDIIVDQYFNVLEKFDLKLEKLEEQLISEPNPEILHKIQDAKLDMVFLRKSVWPIRDVVNRFQHLEMSLVHPVTQVYLKDVYDHIVQIIDMVEGFRDVVAGMLDIYLSNINSRTNDIMKVLTIVSTIFVPLTFLTGLYGMNFEFMPELSHPLGYPIAVFLMVSTAGGMLLFFRRKKWI